MEDYKVGQRFAFDGEMCLVVAIDNGTVWAVSPPYDLSGGIYTFKPSDPDPVLPMDVDYKWLQKVTVNAIKTANEVAMSRMK